MIMPSRRDLSDIANQFVPDEGDEAWAVDPNQPEHMHQGQESGESHSDGWYMYNDGTPHWEKYHSDDEWHSHLRDSPLFFKFEKGEVSM